MWMDSAPARFACLLLARMIIGPISSATAQPAPSLTLTRDLRIDGNVAVLAPIDHLAAGRDGVIAVSQWQAGAVRFFSRDGSPLAAVGRRGDGPGEFRSVSGLGFRGDTLWVYDGSRHRLTFISPEQKVLRTMAPVATANPRPADAARIPEVRVGKVDAVYADGSVQAIVRAAKREDARTFDPTIVRHARVTVDGIVNRIIAAYPEGRSSFYTLVGGGAGGEFPFSIASFYGVSPDGSRTALVTPVVDGPNAPTVEVVMLGATGDTVYSRRYPFTGVPIPKAVADSTIAARSRVFSTEVRAEYRRQAYVPPVYPPIEGIVVGRDSTLWLRQRRTAQGSPYLVLGPRGDVVGSVVLPANVTIKAADRSSVWGLEVDEFDVPSIVRFRISPRA